MTNSELESIKAAVDKIKEDVLTNVILEFYDTLTQQSPDNPLIKYSKADLTTITARALRQLKNELGNKNFEFMSATILDTLNQVNSFIGNTSLITYHPYNNVKFLDYLLYFIEYQVQNGFWDKSAVQYHPVSNQEVLKLKNELTTIQLELADEKKEYQELSKALKRDFDNLNTERTQLSDYLSAISQNLEDSKTQLASTTSNSAAIDSIFTNAEANQKLINQTTTLLEEELKRSKSKVDEKLTELDDLITRVNQLLAIQNKQKEEVDEFIKYTEDAHSTIENKKEEINTFVGLSGSITLGKRFMERGKELVASKRIWAVISVFALVGSIVWTIVVYSKFPANTGLIWLDLAFNLGRILPAYAIVVFGINQYRKERNLEEEYMFKSTVAMTLPAYQDLLSTMVIEGDKKQTILTTISDSMKIVYKQPKINSEEVNSGIRIDTKDIKETLSKLIDTALNNKQP